MNRSQCSPFKVGGMSLARGGEQAVAGAARAMARSSMLEAERDVPMEFVDWSCCCCSQRRGVQGMGVGFLALSLWALVMCSMAAASLSTLHQELVRNATHTNATLPTTKATTRTPATTTSQPPGHVFAPNTPERRRLLAGVYAVVATQALLAGAGAAAAVALVAAAAVGRAPLLLPWMFVAGAEVALLLGGGAYFAFSSMSEPLPGIGVHGFFAFVFMLLLCIPLLYCMKAVHYLYKEFEGGAPNKPTLASRRTAGDSFKHRPASPPPPPPQLQSQRPIYGSAGQENVAYENTAL